MKVIFVEESRVALSSASSIDALQNAFTVPFPTPPRLVYALDDRRDDHDPSALPPARNGPLIAVEGLHLLPRQPAADPRGAALQDLPP